MPLCELCKSENAAARHSYSGVLMCKACFVQNFEDEVHRLIQRTGMIKFDSEVVIGVSGGKDSSVLLTVLYNLCQRYKDCYGGVKLHMLAIDEGIVGYRAESLQVVQFLQQKFNLPLQILSFKERFGRSLDELVKKLHEEDVEQTTLACSYCGILRRQSLSAGAALISKAALVATGHNADDQAETVLLNLQRGDFQKLIRCTEFITDLGVGNAKIKPFALQSQKDIVLYAHFASVKYFSTECPYALTAQRGIARLYIQQMTKKHKMTSINIQMAAQQIKQKHKNPDFQFNQQNIDYSKNYIEILTQNYQQNGVEEKQPQNYNIRECSTCKAPLSGNTCQCCMIKDAITAQDLKRVLKRVQ